MTKCLNCGVKVSSKAKYCSDKCRKAFTRRTNKSDINPDKPKSDTPSRTEPKCRIGLPERTKEIPNYGQPDCQCRHCRVLRANGQDKQGYTLNHGPYKQAGELAAYEVNRISLPGDKDYGGVAIC